MPSFKGNLKTLIIGKYTYTHAINILGFNGNLYIGKFCSISSNINIIGGDGYHRPDRLSTFPLQFKVPSLSGFNMYPSQDEFSSHNINIGNDVWIGTNVFINKNINIGDGAIVASNSVVTKDIPPYAIVGGNSAKIIKYRFSLKQIQLLQKLKWWDWSIEKIRSNIEIFKLTGLSLENKLINNSFK